MAEHICCKRCDSPNCNGCNINTLSKMLDAGKFDCIMDEHHSVNPTADVVEVVRCQDCVYANDDGTICRYSVGRYTKPNNYCSDGDRKDEDDA